MCCVRYVCSTRGGLWRGLRALRSFWENFLGLICDGGMQTFKERAAEIADHAHNPRGALGEAQDFLRGLDEMERQRRCLGYVR